MTISLSNGTTPPIVFISQLGTDGASWKPVLDQLTRGATTFTYDRPGTGDAPPRPAPNPPLPHGVFAEELAALLEQEGVRESAVVVGHSFGGNVAKVYAGRHPERVAGLVFVDSSIPQSFVVPNEEPTRDGGTQVDTVAGQVDIISVRLPHVPTVVLTRTPGRWDGLTPPPHPAVEDLWLASQRALAETAAAPLIVADDCGHQLPRAVPGLVGYAIDRVHTAASRGRPVELDPAHLTRLGGHLD